MTSPDSGTRYFPRLGPWRLGLLASAVIVLTATGALWLWAEHLYAPDDEAAIQPWDIKHYAMVGHAAFALLFVYLAGTLAQTHMQQAWRQGRNRTLGAALSVVALLLVASGFGLWYAGDDGLRQLCEAGHWVTGFGLPALLALHAVAGRRGR